jgi:hypothetical protein
MTLIEMINTTGQIPNRFTTTKGFTAELDMMERADKSWSAMYWQIVNGNREHLFALKHGATPEEAKGEMKKFLLEHGGRL